MQIIGAQSPDLYMESSAIERHFRIDKKLDPVIDLNSVAIEPNWKTAPISFFVEFRWASTFWLQR